MFPISQNSEISSSLFVRFQKQSSKTRDLQDRINNTLEKLVGYQYEVFHLQMQQALGGLNNQEKKDLDYSSKLVDCSLSELILHSLEKEDLLFDENPGYAMNEMVDRVSDIEAFRDDQSQISSLLTMHLLSCEINNQKPLTMIELKREIQSFRKMSLDS